MLFANFALFVFSLLLVAKSADACVLYSSRIARFFHLSEFLVSFIIVAIISALPEASIAFLAALEGEPSFGLGTLLGSNVADLTLVFGVVALFSAKGIKVKSKLLKKDFIYLLLLLFPVFLGLDGHFSRIEGFALILAGFFFFFTLSLKSSLFRKKSSQTSNSPYIKTIIFLMFSIVLLLVSSHLALRFGIAFAHDASIPPLLIALTLVAIGTCFPELFFSIRAVKTSHDDLALGDILGTVITDATLALGIMIVIRPFSFQPSLIHITGLAMFLAGLLVTFFISSQKLLTKRQGVYLVLFYLLFLLAEFFVT